MWAAAGKVWAWQIGVLQPPPEADVLAWADRGALGFVYFTFLFPAGPGEGIDGGYI